MLVEVEGRVRGKLVEVEVGLGTEIKVHAGSNLVKCRQVESW